MLLAGTARGSSPSRPSPPAGSCFFAAVAIGWPKTPQARLTTELAAAARAAASPWKAPIVGYRDYLNGLSWELQTPIPVAAYKGELEPEFETDPAVRDALFWDRERFWAAWQSGRPVVALVRLGDLVELMTATPPARVVRYSGRHAIVANFSGRSRRAPSPDAESPHLTPWRRAPVQRQPRSARRE